MSKYRIQHNHINNYIDSFDSSKIKGSVVIDLGCGDGYASTRFLELGAKEVYGVDVNLVESDLLDKDKIMYLDDISKVGKHADIIWSHHVIEHVPEPVQFLRLIYDSLKEDGELWIGCPNMLDFVNVFSPGHINNYVLPNLMAQIELAGFPISNASWFFTGGQLRIRVNKSKGTSSWPKPCNDLLVANRRIDTRLLPHKYNW